jgi:hypothetical protein
VQSQKPHSYYTLVQQGAPQKPDITFVNPIVHQLEWVGSMPANAEILVSDGLGKILFRERAEQEETAFSVSNWPAGAYFVKVTSEEGVWSQTLVKY